MNIFQNNNAFYLPSTIWIASSLLNPVPTVLTKSRFLDDPTLDWWDNALSEVVSIFSRFKRISKSNFSSQMTCWFLALASTAPSTFEWIRNRIDSKLNQYIILTFAHGFLFFLLWYVILIIMPQNQSVVSLILSCSLFCFRLHKVDRWTLQFLHFLQRVVIAEWDSTPNYISRIFV